ncbi:unnamed protein product, partial [Didymodactylos carnosus]
MNELSSMDSNKSTQIATFEIQAKNKQPRSAIIRLTIEYRIREKSKEIPIINEHAQHHLQQATFKYGDMQTTNGRSELRREQEHMPPERLHTESIDRERAQVKMVGEMDTSDDGQKTLTTQNGEILVRDMVIQHISEDEKSITSEEVLFEEWSEEYKIRRTDEFDGQTNRLISSKVETTDRKKGDVVKEEYREKNERIKGHKSYDVLREIYRRVPATTYDTQQKRTIMITSDDGDRYEEQQQLLPDRVQTKSDTSLSSYTYNRARQQVPAYSTNTALTSTITSQYDRISNVIEPTTSSQQYRRDLTHQQDQNLLKSTSDNDLVSEEYLVELTHNLPSTSKDSRRTSQYVGLQEFSSKGDGNETARSSSDDLSRRDIGASALVQRTQQQRLKDDTSEEELDYPFGSVYTGLSKIVNEAGRKQRTFSPMATSTIRDTTKEDWRTKHTLSDTDTQEQVEQQQQQEHRLSDEDANVYYTTQNVTILPENTFGIEKKTTMGRIQEVTVRVTRDKTPPEHRKTSSLYTIEPPSHPQSSPSLRRNFKEVTVAIARGSSPEKQKTSTSADNSNDGSLKHSLEKLRTSYSSDTDEEE